MIVSTTSHRCSSQSVPMSVARMKNVRRSNHQTNYKGDDERHSWAERAEHAFAVFISLRRRSSPKSLNCFSYEAMIALEVASAVSSAALYGCAAWKQSLGR